MSSWPISSRTNRRDPFHTSCGGRKIAYLNVDLADEALRELKLRIGETASDRMVRYKCEYCLVFNEEKDMWVQPWHLGHNPLVIKLNTPSPPERII